MKRIFAILSCIPFLLLLGGLAFLFLLSYETQVQFLIDLFNQPTLEKYIREIAYPPAHYNAARVIIPIITLCIGIFTYFFLRNNYYWELLTHLRKRTKWSIRSVWQTLRQQSKFQLTFLVFLLLFYIVRSIYNAYHYPIQHDEYWTFNYFSNGHFLKVFVPGNNHFFNSFGNYLVAQFSASEFLIFRLTVIVGGCFTLLFFYLFLIKTISPKIAVIGSSLLCFSPPFVFYSMYGRGYIFLLLFTILCFWCWIRFTQTHKRYYKLAFTLFAFCGLLSVLTFAYVLLVFFCMSLIQSIVKKWEWRELVTFYLPLLFIIVCWSIPGWLLGQWQATLSYQPEVHHEGFQILTSFLYRNAYFFLGFKKLGLIFWILLMICVFGLRHENDSWNYWHQFALLSFTILFFMSLVQGFEITERFAFHLILMPLAAITFVFTEKFKVFFAYLGLASICLTFTWGTYEHKYINWSVNADRAAVAMSEWMLANDIQEVYLDDNYYKPALIYYFHKNKKALEIYSSAPQSIDFTPFNDKTKYQSIICDSDDAFLYALKGYKAVYKNKAATLFIPKTISN